MRRQIRMSDRAARDLARIQAWHTQRGAGAAARERLQTIIQAIRDLAEQPVTWPRWQIPSMRYRVVQGHMIVYQVQNDTDDNASAGAVDILFIYGPGQER